MTDHGQHDQGETPIGLSNAQTGELTPYTELADVLGHLPLLLREARRVRRLSVRAAARQLDMSQATVFRIETGEDCVLSNVTKVLRWLDYLHGNPQPTYEVFCGPMSWRPAPTASEAKPSDVWAGVRERLGEDIPK
jgi:hypothetical protein